MNIVSSSSSSTFKRTTNFGYFLCFGGGGGFLKCLILKFFHFRYAGRPSDNYEEYPQKKEKLDALIHSVLISSPCIILSS